MSELTDYEYLLTLTEGVRYNAKGKNINLKGDGSDETEKFQEMLNRAQTEGKLNVYFPKGVYGIRNVVQIFSNTHIEMHEEAVIKMIGNDLKMITFGELNNPNFATGYNGAHDISIKGGTLDGNGVSTLLLGIGHTKNLLFESVRFINTRNGHSVECNSSYNVQFIRCTFENMVSVTSTNREFLQLDFASAAGFPSFGAYDYTPCSNILIDGCAFKNGDNGIGCHSGYIDDAGNEFFHENIRITNCNFENVKYAIRVQSFKNSTVSGNTINDADMGIIILSNENTVISNNTIQNTISDGIRIYNGQNSTTGFNRSSYRNIVANNVLVNLGQNGIRMSNAHSNLIANNIIKNVSKEGLFMIDSHKNHINNIVVEGAAQLTSGSYSCFRIESSNDNVLNNIRADNTTYPKNYYYGLYIASGQRNHISEYNFMPGESTFNNGIISGELANNVSNGEWVQLFTGDLGTNGASGTLLMDINIFSSILIVANDNNSSAAQTVTMEIPKPIYKIGTASRHRIVPDSNSGDRVDFSFINSKTIQVDSIQGTGHIRMVLGRM
ncbi:right-handed parallel beta-helix repeat-containing protein [Niallia alba]|uniref:right-handed parallel beta-helix repeat-containing protein n=1 Tax=Niallia alba TaxID=2729105 RepID=UPI002E22D3E8|nr:right-handed parallel beta-helix repeat-containing protein [Niallia alba]